MALLFSDGFDGTIINSGSAGAISLVERYTLVTLPSATIASGLGAMTYNDTRQGCNIQRGGGRMSKTLSPSGNTCIVGFALALLANPVSNVSILYIATGGSGSLATPNNAGIQLSVVVNSNKTISVYQGYFEGGGATLLGTSVTALSNVDPFGNAHLFQYIEIKAVIGPAGSVEVRLSPAYNNFNNGDPCPAYPSPAILSLPGVNTQPHGSGTWDTVSFVAVNGVFNQTRILDDIYIADGSGGNNDFIGPVVVALTTAEPNSVIAGTYSVGGGSPFANGGALDTGDSGKNVGQGSFLGASIYYDDGSNTFVVSTTLNGLFSAYMDVPRLAPGSPNYYPPDRGVAGVIAYHAMKGIVFGGALVLAQGLVRFPGGVSGTDYLGKTLNSQIVNSVNGGATTDYDQEDPHDARPDGVQWVRANLYAKQLGNNPGAAEFGIKCVGLTGNPDCVLGKIFVHIVYGHFIAAANQVKVSQLPMEILLDYNLLADHEASSAWITSAGGGSGGSAGGGGARQACEHDITQPAVTDAAACESDVAPAALPAGSACDNLDDV